MNIIKRSRNRLLQFLSCRHPCGRDPPRPDQLRHAALAHHHAQVPRRWARNTCRSPSSSAFRRLTRSWRISPACTWTSWGEMEMVGTIMDRDVEMVPCETLDLTVPAEAEIVVEGRINLNGRIRVGEVTSPSMYHLPHYEDVARGRDHRDHHARAIGRSTAITRPCPDTDHQTAAAALSRGGPVQPAHRDGAERQGRALSDMGRRAVLHSAGRRSRAKASSTMR